MALFTPRSFLLLGFGLVIAQGSGDYLQPETRCGKDEFRCNDGHCIFDSYVCDDHNDCGDLSDEQHCPAKSTKEALCPPSEFFCDLICAPLDWKCDGNEDCPSGIDEKDCEAFGPKATKESMTMVSAHNLELGPSTAQDGKAPSSAPRHSETVLSTLLFGCALFYVRFL